MHRCRRESPRAKEESMPPSPDGDHAGSGRVVGPANRRLRSRFRGGPAGFGATNALPRTESRRPTIGGPQGRRRRVRSSDRVAEAEVLAGPIAEGLESEIARRETGRWQAEPTSLACTLPGSSGGTAWNQGWAIAHPIRQTRVSRRRPLASSTTASKSTMTPAMRSGVCPRDPQASPAQSDAIRAPTPAMPP